LALIALAAREWPTRAILVVLLGVLGFAAYFWSNLDLNQENLPARSYLDKLVRFDSFAKHGREDFVR